MSEIKASERAFLYFVQEEISQRARLGDDGMPVRREASECEMCSDLGCYHRWVEVGDQYLFLCAVCEEDLK